MKIQSIAILAFAASLFAQEAASPAAPAAPAAPVAQTAPAAPAPVASAPQAQAPAPAPAAPKETPISCRAAFDVVKNTYPRDIAADFSYASVNARITTLESVAKNERKGAIYEAELKTCDLAVELFKIQLSRSTLRKSLDSLTGKNREVQKEISAVKDSLIDLWTSLSDDYNRLQKLNREKAEEQARLAAELVKKEKALAEKDSLLAVQKAEAEKRLEALRSKTISVYKDARGTILSMSDILFETGKADLKPELKENLAGISVILNTLLTESSVVIEGHTDSVGGEQINQFLSEQRALSVLNYLVERDVVRDRLKSVGYGLTRPVANNSTPEGRAKNRRVELVIKD